MTDLIKHQIVLDRFGDQFLSRYDGDGPTCVLSLDPQVWADMGKPDTVTVTVEPGDLLNDGGQQ